MDTNNSIVMTRQQVRQFDAWAINKMGIPGCMLMENAGRNCAKLILKRLTDVNNANVIIFCGIGNNGGDGYVIARHLVNAQINVKIAICGDISKIKGDARLNLDIIKKMEIPVVVIDPLAEDITMRIADLTTGTHLLIDALFGTGLTGQMRNGYPDIVRSLNGCKKPIVAVDIPSGLDCDLGLPTDSNTAIIADATVTFVAMKKGFTNPATLKYTGDITIASIGIEPSAQWDRHQIRMSKHKTPF